MIDELIKIPSFLSADDDAGIQATACSYCSEVACETSAELGCDGCEGDCEHTSQGCTSTCEKACQTSCQTGCQSACETSSQGSPPSSTVSFSVSATGSGTLRVSWSSVSGAADYQIAYRPSASGSSSTVYKSVSGTAYTISSLQPETEYTVNIRAHNSYGYGPFNTTGKTATTLSARPKYWSWTNGLVASKPAVGALSSGADIPVYLSASGWTLFVQNIKDVYSYRMGTSYSGTLENGGNGMKKLSAAMVNQAITAIRTMTSTYLPGQTTSNITKLSASLLNGLADSLNSIT